MADRDTFRMPLHEIGRILNPHGSGTCPWCRAGGPMTVGEHGVAWRCGHARSLPPLHATEKTTRQCTTCTPPVRLRAVA